MSLNIFKTTSLSLSLLFVIGCGSGGDSNSVTGTFIDSAVSGLTYKCAPSGGSGVTNAKGEFTCTKGDNVSFKLGGVPLGVTVSADTEVITPYALFPDNDGAALNLAQLLQSIDSDGDPSNGISPLPAHVESLGGGIDFTRVDFDTHAPTLLSGIGSLVNEADAKEHLHDSVIASGITIPQVNTPKVIVVYDETVKYFVPYLVTGDKETKLPDIEVIHSELSPFPYPFTYAYANGKHFFVGIDASGANQLYVSDGTPEGTKIIEAVIAIEEELEEEIAKGPALGSKFIYSLTAVENKVFFGVSTGKYAGRLWVSDGSESGTNVVGEAYVYPYLTKFGSNLIFSGHNDTNGPELWISDGTDSGTKMLKDINPLGSSLPNNYKVVKDKIFFKATDGTHGYELWVSDGTTTGTNLVKDLSSAGDSDPKKMIAVGIELYFIARDDIGNEKFWVSDGTEAGTVVVPDIQDLMDNVNNYININDSLYASVYEDNKIYKVDKGGATVVGTLPVDEIEESYLFNINDKIYVVTYIPESGDGDTYVAEHQELYIGDIQADGTIIFSKHDFKDQGFDIRGYGIEDDIKIENVGDTIYIEVFYIDSEGEEQASLVRIKDNTIIAVGDALAP